MAVPFMKMTCPLMTEHMTARIVAKERMAAMIANGTQRIPDARSPAGSIHKAVSGDL